MASTHVSDQLGGCFELSVYYYMDVKQFWFLPMVEGNAESVFSSSAASGPSSLYDVLWVCSRFELFAHVGGLRMEIKCHCVHRPLLNL